MLSDVLDRYSLAPRGDGYLAVYQLVDVGDGYSLAPRGDGYDMDEEPYWLFKDTA